MTKCCLNVIPARRHYYLHAFFTVHNQLQADFCHYLPMEKETLTMRVNFNFQEFSKQMSKLPILWPYTSASMQLTFPLLKKEQTLREDPI